MSIKRYDQGLLGMLEEDEGDWCKYEDIERLLARLEIREDGGPDGIECRDETIRMQDREIDRLRAENERLRGVLEYAANYADSICATHLVEYLEAALRGEEE